MSALDSVTGSFNPRPPDDDVSQLQTLATNSSGGALDATPSASQAAETESTSASGDMSRWDEEGKQTTSASPPPLQQSSDAATATGHDSSSKPEAAPSAPSQEESVNDSDRYVSVVFRDGLDLPIEGLEISIPLPDGTLFTCKTTSQGVVTVPIPVDASGKAEVQVTDTTGVKQTVCALDLAECQSVAVIRSPKTIAKGKLRQHQQNPPGAASAPGLASKDASAALTSTATTSSAAAKPASISASSAKASSTPASAAKTSSSSASAALPPSTAHNAASESESSTVWWGANGAFAHGWQWIRHELSLNGEVPAAPPASATLANGLSAAGQPVTAMIGPECPNSDCLKLGKNNIYRNDILGASKRLGLVPQALCALINCEAALTIEEHPLVGKTGKPLTDKAGKPRVSKVAGPPWNAASGTSGSSAAGLTQFLKGTWLAIALDPSYYIHDKCVAAGWVRQVQMSKNKTSWAFVLANGTTTTRPQESNFNDANARACLAKRLDPTWSIYSAADYGAANLKILQSKFKLAGLADLEKAKLMYMMHHEGGFAGPHFVAGTMTPTPQAKADLKKTLASQLGKPPESIERADALVKVSGGDVQKAYRQWLSDYIDKKFASIDLFYCTPQPKIRMLSELLVAIGGVEISTT